MSSSEYLTSHGRNMLTDKVSSKGQIALRNRPPNCSKKILNLIMQGEEVPLQEGEERPIIR